MTAPIRFTAGLGSAAVAALGFLAVVSPAEAAQPSVGTSGTTDFVITIDTNQPGRTGPNEFMIPTDSALETYNYNVDCNNDGVYEATGVTGNYANGDTGIYTCDYTNLGGPGTYTIRISDNAGDGTGFPGIRFGPHFLYGTTDAAKLMSIDQWGTGHWKSMNSAFWGAYNMVGAFSDAPDLSEVTSLYGTFWGATAFNGDIGDWDTSHVTTMQETFHNAASFNADISNWDTTNVTNMSAMLTGSGLSTANYDALLEGWSKRTQQSNVKFSAAGVTYCNSTARAVLTNTYGWEITDGGPSTQPCLVPTPSAEEKAAGLLEDPAGSQVWRLYSAYFLRHPDQVGFDYWLQIRQTGVSQTVISDLFAGSKEFDLRYGSLDNGEFVNQVYRNVFLRDADQEGSVYWVGLLDRGMSRGEMMLMFSESREYLLRTGTSWSLVDGA